MQTIQKVQPVLVSNQQFMPASQSLFCGMLTAAAKDLTNMIKVCSELLLELWLETVFTSAVFIQRLRGMA